MTGHLTSKGGAARRAKRYGHKLGSWVPMTTWPKGVVAHCENCPARVYVDPSYTPRVYGPAVTYRCPEEK